MASLSWQLRARQLYQRKSTEHGRQCDIASAGALSKFSIISSLADGLDHILPYNIVIHVYHTWHPWNVSACIPRLCFSYLRIFQAIDIFGLIKSHSGHIKGRFTPRGPWGLKCVFPLLTTLHSVLMTDCLFFWCYLLLASMLDWKLRVWGEFRDSCIYCSVPRALLHSLAHRRWLANVNWMNSSWSLVHPFVSMFIAPWLALCDTSSSTYSSFVYLL